MVKKLNKYYIEVLHNDGSLSVIVIEEKNLNQALKHLYKTYYTVRSVIRYSTSYWEK